MKTPPSTKALSLPAGMRSTRATRALVALLRSTAASRLTAAEAQAAMARMGVVVNRVTVFRALDRLAQAGLLQRNVDEDRLTRYQWQIDKTDKAHNAHSADTPAAPGTVACQRALPLEFQCVVCHTVSPVLLDDSKAVLALQVLAHGMLRHGAQQVTRAAFQGTCQRCAEA